MLQGPSGFGITLTEGTTAENIRGIFVTGLSPDSQAHMDKMLKVGDQVLAVNGHSVQNMPANKVYYLNSSGYLVRKMYFF